MPIYEYRCTKCESDCELLIRSDERPVCPACGSVQLQKLLSVTAAPSFSGRAGTSGESMPGSCGKPQCGMGRCMGMGDD